MTKNEIPRGIFIRANARGEMEGKEMKMWSQECGLIYRWHTCT